MQPVSITSTLTENATSALVEGLALVERVRRAKPPRPTAGAMLTAVKSPAPSHVGRVAQALADALAGDGLESALIYSDQLWSTRATLTPESLACLAPDLARAALLRADVTRGRELLDALGTPPARTSAWLCALEALVRAPQLPPWRDAEGFSPYLTAAHVSAGRLDAAPLTQYLLRHPSQAVRQPDALLLLHNARRNRTDAHALTAYLNAHGVACDVSLSDRGFADLAVEAPGSQRHSGPRISVLMAAYNARDTIVQAARSVLEQSYGNVELLVCDDDSRDDTLDVLRDALGSDRRLKLYRSRANQGAYNLRNALLEKASGELVTFHDADDISLPGRFGAQVAELRKRPAIGVVTSWLRFRPDGSAVFFADGRASRMSVVSLLVRTDALTAVGRYPSARFGADLDVLRRLERRFGARALVRVRVPWLFGFWSEQSVTRRAASAALESGFRAAPRRAYAEFVFRRMAGELADDDQLASLLHQTGNFLPSHPIIPA